MVKREDQPVEKGESLIRRFNCTPNQVARLPKEPVPMRAFLPRPPNPRTNFAGDTDGLSIYRSDCLDHPKDLVAHLDPNRGVQTLGMVSLDVDAVADAGMSVEPAPSEGPAGHCVIPELNCNAEETFIEDMSRALQCRARLMGVYKAGTGDLVFDPNEE